MKNLESKNSYNEINDFLQNLPKNFSILQEEIDIEVQVAYFERAKKIKPSVKDDKKDLALKIAELNITESTDEEKKNILIQLATIDDVKAFRAIENFVSKATNPELKSWATLAMQESRMTMESSLLDENQVFISTGLGGKGDKLRYFIVGFLNEDAEFTETQKNLLKKEFEYSLEQHDSEVEQIEFEQKYALITALIPLKNPIKDMLKSAIDECVELGMDLSEHFMVTNVKKLGIDEIDTFIKEQIENGIVDEDLEIDFDIEGDFDDE
jgi:hypothetical protein